MNELRKSFYKSTGLTCDVEKLINNCTTEEEKVKMYKTLSWRMKAGVITSNPNSKISQLHANVLTNIAKNLDVELINDMNKDGDIDSTDKKLFEELNRANNILSSLEIEINPDEPTDTPVEDENPSDEPTDTPVEDENPSDESTDTPVEVEE